MMAKRNQAPNKIVECRMRRKMAIPKVGAPNGPKSKIDHLSIS
jgi:hypothetical protein